METALLPFSSKSATRFCTFASLALFLARLTFRWCLCSAACTDVRNMHVGSAAPIVHKQAGKQERRRSTCTYLRCALLHKSRLLIVHLNLLIDLFVIDGLTQHTLLSAMTEENTSEFMTPFHRHACSTRIAYVDIRYFLYYTFIQRCPTPTCKRLRNEISWKTRGKKVEGGVRIKIPSKQIVRDVFVCCNLCSYRELRQS